MYIVSCSAPIEYRKCNEDCAFCSNANPASDCPYLEIDDIDNDNLEF